MRDPVITRIGRLAYIDERPESGVRQKGTLVLLHAFPLNARMWAPQLPLSGRGWRIVAPQDRGFDGDTARDAGQHPPAASIDDYVADVIDILDHLHIDEAVVCGQSMGGYVALGMMRLAPRYIQGLVLACTRAEADSPEGREARRAALQLVEARGVPALVEDMLPKLVGETTKRCRPEVVDRVRALGNSSSKTAIAAAIHVMMTRPDSRPLLETIHVPTLIIAGEEDRLIPPASSEALHAAIAHSRFDIIPEAGHLTSIEQPVIFNSTLSRLLDSL